MKILITSDTHGYYVPVSEYILSHDDIDLLIHAGDGIEDVKNIYYETGINYYTVKGNNDYFSNESYDKIIQILNKKIFITHGHNYKIDYYFDKILEKSKSLKADITIFGHTHQYYNNYIDNILFLNPGSISLPRDGNSGFMIIDISNEKFSLERVFL